MRPLRDLLRVSAVALSFGLVSGCNGGTPITAQVSDELNRCALLNDTEIRDAIGAHGSGQMDPANEWGLQSCRWTASTPQKSDEFPNGWFDSIEVAVFENDRTTWARGQARGEPVQGFVAGAVYDATYGELWFDCARDRFCVVKAHTADAQTRAPTARRLAELVEMRLR